MDEKTLQKQLVVAAEDQDDFSYATEEIVEELSDDDTNFCFVGVILRFMEQNPTLDFGTPGALVHFAEKYFRRGYEQELTKSVTRRPVVPTLGMLNRLINGIDTPEVRSRLIKLMENSAVHPAADTETRRLAKLYLENY